MKRNLLVKAAAAAGAAGAGLALTAGAAGASTTVTVTPSTNLRDGQTVTVDVVTTRLPSQVQECKAATITPGACGAPVDLTFVGLTPQNEYEFAATMPVYKAVGGWDCHDFCSIKTVVYGDSSPYLTFK